MPSYEIYIDEVGEVSNSLDDKSYGVGVFGCTTKTSRVLSKELVKKLDGELHMRRLSNRKKKIVAKKAMDILKARPRFGERNMPFIGACYIRESPDYASSKSIEILDGIIENNPEDFIFATTREALDKLKNRQIDEKTFLKELPANFKKIYKAARLQDIYAISARNSILGLAQQLRKPKHLKKITLNIGIVGTEGVYRKKIDLINKGFEESLLKSLEKIKKKSFQSLNIPEVEVRYISSDSCATFGYADLCAHVGKRIFDTTDDLGEELYNIVSPLMSEYKGIASCEIRKGIMSF